MLNLSHTRLKELLEYNPTTGVFRWKSNPRRGGAYKAGDRAGTINVYGRRRMKVGKEQCYSGPMAWFYMTGVWPTNEIDHINRDPLDDSWVNLREVSHEHNIQNRGLHKSSTSGVAGVLYKPAKGKWEARIQVRRKVIFLGLFLKKEDAIQARFQAEFKYFDGKVDSDVLF